MPVRLLDELQAGALRAAPLSYASPLAPDAAASNGFRVLTVSAVLTRRDFDAAARDLLGWRMHERAGLRVAASDVPLRLGSVVLMRWGIGPLSMAVPCRVLDVVEEPRRRGFTYGTLPGHPEAGEEQFVLEHLDDDRIRLTIGAVSRPASALARLGGPLTRAAQSLMTRRYLRALDRL
jgi:uncharacterized protein (UPF0548 family)